MLCCAGHRELTIHTWENKCAGVIADHVKKHLGSVCATIYAGMLVCVRAHRQHPHDHHKIETSPLIHHTCEYKTSFVKDKNKHDKVTVWSF